MITVNGFKPKIENFGNGESNLTLPFLNELEDPIANFKVVWSYKNDLEIWSIKQIESILEHYLEKNFGFQSTSVQCTLNYMPYERMDRWDEKSRNAYSLQSLVSILPKYWTYTIIEPHSKATEYMFKMYDIDYKLIYTSFETLKKYVSNKDNYKVVFPDKGAWSRYGEMYQEDPVLSSKNYLIGEKERDFNTHKITNYSYTEHVVNEEQFELEHKSIFSKKNSKPDEFIIVDDICSYGNTFIKLSDEIHKRFPEAKITLIITHAERVMFNDKLMNSNIDKFIFTDSILPKMEYLWKNYTDKVIAKKYGLTTYELSNSKKSE